MMSDGTWRVVLNDGTVRDVVVHQLESSAATTYYCVDRGGPVRALQRSAIAAWCDVHALDAVEIRGPGELTAAEQVSAETARCASLCRQVGYMGDETRTPAQVARECAKAILREVKP